MKRFLLILGLMSTCLLHSQEQPKNTTASDIISNNTSKVLKTKDFKTLLQVSTFPNPIVKEMTIDFSDYGNYEVFLYDLNGKVICKRNINDDIQSSFDLTNLKSGIYTIIVIDREHEKMAHLRIQKE